MTMSPQIRRHGDLDMNADETTLDHTGTRATFTNPPTNYHSHAKISGRNGHKKGSVEHVPNHHMSAVMPGQQFDTLPSVKNASKSKKTF